MWYFKVEKKRVRGNLSCGSNSFSGVHIKGDGYLSTKYML